MSLRRIGTAALLVTLAFALSACDPGAGGTPPPTAPATPTITPEPTPTPTPTPEALVPTCQNIVSPETIAGFTSDGISITPPADFAAKVSSEGSALSVFFDAGGVLCQTGAGLEANEIYGYAVIADGYLCPLEAEFLRDGYEETTVDLGIQYKVPDGAEGLPRLCYLRPGAFSICGNDDARLSEIMETLGLS
ncbi:hypothetical protein BH09ACT4_BH09ACT4_19240 [soil metagenome]